MEYVKNFETKHSIEHQLCEDHFNAKTLRDANGRFVVSLPFRESAHLGNSKHQAILRFINLEKRLFKHPEVQQQYTSFIHEYILLAHMRPVLPN